VGSQAEREWRDARGPTLAWAQVGSRAVCDRHEMEDVESGARPREDGRGLPHRALG
jgi:hypothetical protein